MGSLTFLELSCSLECWIPSSALVFSIVRKGELLLSKLGSCQDTQDDQLICSISELSCREEVEALCEASVVSPPLLARHWTRYRIRDVEKFSHLLLQIFSRS